MQQKLVTSKLDWTACKRLLPHKSRSADLALHPAAQSRRSSRCKLLPSAAAGRHVAGICLITIRSPTCTALRFSRRAAAVKSALLMPTCTLPALSALYSTFPPLKSLTACGRAQPMSHHQYKGSSLQCGHRCSVLNLYAVADRLRSCGSGRLTSESCLKPCAAVLQSCNVDKDVC